MNNYHINQLESIERKSLDELHHTVEIPLLYKQLKYADLKSKLWNSWFKHSGVTVEEIRTVSDFQNIPLSDKQDILDDQNDVPPYGSLLSVGISKVLRVHRTAGSTNRPLLVLLTERDIENTLTAGSRAFQCAGVSSEDIVIHCLNYCMWSGGFTDHQCIERAGAAVIPFGVGNSKHLIETIMRLKPTAISCTPSYFVRLEALLHDEFQAEPSSLGLKKAIFGGEPGLQNPELRKDIEDKWDLKAIDANYGLSDVLSIFGSECEFRRGLHFHGQGILMPELIDQHENSVAIEKGNTGELVLTCLLREAQPLFRYRTHDAIKIVDTGLCPCGRRSFIFKVMGRTDDMIIIKGINFHPNSLQGLFKRFRDILTGDYRIILPKGQFQSLRIQVEMLSLGNHKDLTLLKSKIEQSVREEHFIRVEVEFVPKGFFKKSDGKTNRLIRE